MSEQPWFQIERPPAAAMAEYFALRWQVLRAPWGQPRGSERDALEGSSEHLAARQADGCLVGIGRLQMNDAVEAQIRYMAVDEPWRGRGVGTAIVQQLEQMARARGAKRIVLNARDDAVGFYLRMGYRVVGAGPTLFGEIVHARMEKLIDVPTPVTDGPQEEAQ